MKKLSILIVFSVIFLTLGCNKSEKIATQSASQQQEIKWKLVTAWPKNFPGLGMAPEHFAKLVNEMSAGRLQVSVYGAGELVPAFQVFDAVSEGAVQMGHSAPYYWKGKLPEAQFFAGIPFGLNAQQMNGWLNQGGGLTLWQAVYAPFNLIPLPGGNIGTQMGGWFNRRIDSVNDLQGLKMRIPGLGADVLNKVGGVAVTLPGNELFTAMQTGAIDATEWANPYNDLAFGFHKIAKYYYYPGWQEPGVTLEFIINKTAFDALPDDLKAIVKTAAQAVNQRMLDEYTVNNVNALKSLVNEHNVQILPFPEEVLQRLHSATNAVISELVEKNPNVKKVYINYKNYQQGIRQYHRISEDAYNQYMLTN